MLTASPSGRMFQVMNADPRYFENASLLNQISYREAIELAFYGATVIHQKTLQPLQRKEIPLYVSPLSTRC
jgi:aspartate kinase